MDQAKSILKWDIYKIRSSNARYIANIKIK
jgi:hypothetical protein